MKIDEKKLIFTRIGVKGKKLPNAKPTPEIKEKLQKALDLALMVKSKINFSKSDDDGSWATVNGRHIFFANKDTGGVKGAGLRHVDNMTSHEGAPDTKRVDNYKQLIKQGKTLAPVLVTKEKDGKLGIEDGKHRYEAYKQSGVKLIPTLNKDTATTSQMASYDRATIRDQKAIERLGGK